MGTDRHDARAGPVISAHRWETTLTTTGIGRVDGPPRARRRPRLRTILAAVAVAVVTVELVVAAPSIVAAVQDLSGARLWASTWTAAATYSLVNWVLDITALAVCLVATGVPVPGVGAVLLAYAAAMAASNLSLLPFGIGTTDLALIAALVAAGSDAHAVLPAVVLYRLISTGAPTVAGWTLGAKELRRRPATT